MTVRRSFAARRPLGAVCWTEQDSCLLSPGTPRMTDERRWTGRGGSARGRAEWGRWARPRRVGDSAGERSERDPVSGSEGAAGATMWFSAPVGGNLDDRKYALPCESAATPRPGQRAVARSGVAAGGTRRSVVSRPPGRAERGVRISAP